MLHYLGAFELMVDNLIHNEQVQDKMNFEQDLQSDISESSSSVNLNVHERFKTTKVKKTSL